MARIQSFLAAFCVCLSIAPLSTAQDRIVLEEPQAGHFGVFTRPYRQRRVPPIDLANSPRLEALLRAGKLYLSLKDAVALALENNLDIAMARYDVPIAQTDLLRAQAGGLLRGVPTNVSSGPANAGGQFLLGSGGGPAANTGAVSGTNGVITQIGPTTPNFDPVLQGSISWAHQTTPQTNFFSYGTNALVATNKLANFVLSQGFPSGANAQLSYNNFFTSQNSGRFDIDPYTTSSLDLLITQPLLQGFGFAVNRRTIRVAKNNLRLEDAVFRQQVIATVSNIVGLYWNLVTLNAQVKVAREALGVSEKLYGDNKKQVEVGTLAPIEITRAEAEVAANQQNLTIAETNVLQQETTIKNVLSRTGVASPAAMEARIVPTDSIQMPEIEQVQPVQDLMDTALADRPEIAEGRINLENSETQTVGSRNELFPALSAFVQLTNHAQIGEINTIPNLDSSGNPVLARTPVNGIFIGGYSGVLAQLFGRNFPDYRVGVNLNIPLRNRAAQADYARDQLSLRQSQLGLQKQINQVRADVQNALISLQQARARYQAAVKQRVLEEQTLDAERKKYELGASAIYTVIQTQRDLTTAQSSEVAALSQYSQARVTLDTATGQILRKYEIDIDEAVKGVVSRAPSALPVLEPNGGAGRGAAAGRAR